MKKIIALMLALLTVAVMLAACTGTGTAEKPQETKTEETAATTEDATGKTGEPTENPVDPDKVTTPFDETKLYEIKASDGTVLQWDYFSIAEAKTWDGGVWSVGKVEQGEGQSVSVLYAGDDLVTALTAGTLLADKELKVDNICQGQPSIKQGWYIRDNGDGTYKIVSAANPVFCLDCKNGKFVLEFTEKSTAAFTFTEAVNQNVGTLYAEYSSAKGNITVRLEPDMVDQVYKAVKRSYKDVAEEEVKARINDRLQMFADSVQKTYDALVELTDFAPYTHIIVKAWDKQGVMAGVVGANCNIFVNNEWYDTDMIKMWQRWEDGKEDFNFCILHEMGHMFDWDRGWNFESEMETDLKASYVLYKYRNDEYGAWAAPAEYEWNKVFNIDTIDTGGYKGLSADMKYRKQGDNLSYSYSIYRSAQMYTSYVKYCEAEPNLRGYEALMDTFHWFQAEGLRTSSLTPEERFNTFNAKLTEFTGQDIDEYMTSHFKKNDWLATAANAAGLDGKQK